jgi:D-alanyl-D-alanine carboxypeptidase (penicillin-binding protein 5/6)
MISSAQQQTSGAGHVPVHVPALATARLLALVVIHVVMLAIWAPLTGGMDAHAQAQPREFASRVKHAIMIDGDTGGVLYRHNADELTAPASMSKLMTVAIVFRLMKERKLQPTDEFVMSVNAWRRGGAPSGTSAMMVPVNTKVSLDELLQGIIVQSGNDASIAIAEGISGSEEAFARLMEQEARRIGLAKSQFRNATGLHHPDHLMTVRELALLARHMMTEYPQYFHLFAQREFLYRRHKFLNRNPHLFSDPNVDGMKTGHTRQAGFGVVVTARANGRRLIIVVAGAETEAERRAEVRRMLEWGSTNISQFKLYDADEVVGRARVFGGTAFYVPLVGEGEVSVWLPRYPASQRLRGEIVYSGPLKAPVAKGAQVARLRVTSTNNATQEVPLYAAQDVGEGGIVRRGLDSLAHLAFGLIRR